MRYHELESIDLDGHVTSGRSAVKSGLTQQQIQEILDRHNELRRNEGAANMEVLVSIILAICQLGFDSRGTHRTTKPFNPHRSHTCRG